MDLDGSHLFDAPVDRVWAALNDPGVLARVTPGCESLAAVGPDEYEATLSVGVASVKGTYTGRLAIVDREPPRAYTLRVDGRGRPGFVRGDARVTLTEEGQGTRARVQARAQVGGMIAAVGQRLLGGAARMMMEQFFVGLDRELAAGAAPAAAPGEPGSRQAGAHA